MVDPLKDDLTFQPTRPLRGATRFQEQSNRREEFQPTRPLRGATWRSEEKAAVFVISTHAPLAGRDLLPTTLAPSSSYFNPRAPCGARHHEYDSCPRHSKFQPTRPLRGATRSGYQQQHPHTHFNPRAPCGARQGQFPAKIVKIEISTHAPLAGRDWTKSNKFLTFDKFQPTRPLRGATVTSPCKCRVRHISTHAPLAGRDPGHGAAP